MDSGRDLDSRAIALSSRPIAVQTRWRDLVLRIDGPVVLPSSVTVEGRVDAVENPRGLHDGEGLTILRSDGAHQTRIIVDLGRVTMGRVELGVIELHGAPLRASYAEFRQFLAPDGDGMGAPFGTDAHPWSRVDVFEPTAQPRMLVSPGKREARYLLIMLDGPGTAVLSFVRVRQTIYPVSYDGYFLSSDELLNRAWYASAYTGDLATVTENGSPWMLTATFDRVLFMGDLHMQALAGYAQSRDHAWLMRNTLRQFSCIQRPDGSLPCASSHLFRCSEDPSSPTGCRHGGPDPELALGYAGPYSLFRDIYIDSFTAFWVAALADYYLHTADAEFVRSRLTIARRAIAFFEGRTTPQGLYYEPPDRRSDPGAARPWVANWSPGDIATGVDSFSNAAWYNALEGLALLEEHVASQPEVAQGLRVRAEQLRQALLAHAWDSEAGAMILNDADPRRDHTGDANAGNLMFGTLDRARAESVMRFLDEKLSTPHGTRSSELPDNPWRAADIQGYINAMEALGRARYGDGAGAVGLIRRWWGHMLSTGPGTGWFRCNEDGSVERGAFANSAWTTAIPAITEGVLGIRPLAPGYRRWRIAPQLLGLAWAQGRVPIPSGQLDVRWERTDQGFVCTVATPRDREGVVAIPCLGADRTIAGDGHILWRGDEPAPGVEASREGDAIVFSGIRGERTFAWADR